MNRIISLFVVLLLLTGTFCGCAQKDEKPKQEEKQNEAKSNFNETGMPIVNKTVNYNIFRRDSDGNIDEMIHYNELEERSNIDIIWTTIAASGWNERKNLMFASGDYPDAIFGSGFTDLDILNNSEVLLPLNDLIDKYAPYIVKAFDEEPECKKLVTAPDGNIYSFPQVRQLVDTPQMIGINTTWLERLGLEMPETTDDFYKVLKAFKTGDPNQNSKDDEIPLTFRINGGVASWAPFFGPFGILDYSSPKTPLSEHVNVIDGEVIFVPADQRYVEAIKYFHKLYSEKLLDQEVFVQDSSQYTAKTKNPDDIVGVCVNWTISNAVGFERAEKDFAVLKPLIGPNGDQLSIKNNGAKILRNMGAIFTDCKNPEILMRWFNELYEEDMAIQLMYGPFGLVTEVQDDGTVVPLPIPEGLATDEFKWGNTTAGSTPTCILDSFADRIVRQPSDVLKWEAHEKYYKPYHPKEIYPNVYYTAEQVEELKVLLADIETYVENQQAKWVMEGGIEEEWEDYLNQLDKMGLDKLMKIYVDAYNSYLGR